MSSVEGDRPHLRRAVRARRVDAGADTGILHQTVTFGSAGPLGGYGTRAHAVIVRVRLDGATPSPTRRPSASSRGSSTPRADRAPIIGFSDDSIDSGQSVSDRSLWVSGGKLYWGVIAGRREAGSQRDSVGASAWHLAVARSARTGSGSTSTARSLHQLPASTAAQSYTGYWHLGWGGETGWTNAPANAYWPGSLADIAVVPSQLTAAQITTLWTQTTNAAEQTQILALHPDRVLAARRRGHRDLLRQRSGYGHSAVLPTPPVRATPAPATERSPPTCLGPLGATAAGFDGPTSWMSSTTQYTDPHPLTITAWFKTSVASGTIIEFADIQNGLTGFTTWDRHIWVDSAGHLVWGVWPGQEEQVTSSGLVRRRQLAPGRPRRSDRAGMRLYVDGTLVGVEHRDHRAAGLQRVLAAR